MPIGRPWRASIARIALTSSRMRGCGVWLMLMRKTSAPAMNSRSIIAGSDEAGPSVATILVRRSRFIASVLRAGFVPAVAMPGIPVAPAAA